MTEPTTTPKPRAKRGTGAKAQKSAQEKADLAILTLKRLYEASTDDARKMIRVLVTSGAEMEPALLREVTDAAQLIDEVQAQDALDLFSVIDNREEK